MVIRRGFSFISLIIILGLIGAASTVVYVQKSSDVPTFNQFIQGITPSFIQTKHGSPESVPSPLPITEATTIGSLFESKVPLECTATNSSTPTYNGTIYLDPSNRSFRLDTSHEGYPGHMLYLNDTIWGWDDLSDNGIVFTRASLTTTDPSKDPLSSTTQLDCTPWEIDATLLKVPTEITFKDPQETIDAAWRAKEALDARIREEMIRQQSR